MGAFKKLDQNSERETSTDTDYFRADLASQMPKPGDYCINESTNSLGKVISVEEGRAGYIDIKVQYAEEVKVHSYWGNLKFYKKMCYILE